MKKFISFCATLCLMITTMYAQRAAVLEFKAGVGLSQTDVDGISAIFITYFRPSGYTMVERTQIDRAIEEQGFQRSKLSEQQMVKIGQILNVSKIVVGDINVVMGQYNVDVRVLNVQSGTIAATEGETFDGSSYRTTMQSLAQKLAGKIAVNEGPSVQPSPNSKEPTVLYGYLTVFPNDLGEFGNRPYSIINQINKHTQYGYGTWRLPTVEELNLLRANNLIGTGTYMASDGRSDGIVRLVTEKAKGEIRQPSSGYVDLGLPSGTYWKKENEPQKYSLKDGIKRFGTQLPTYEQLDELRYGCTWTRNGHGYDVVGPNGNSIFISGEGYSFYLSSTSSRENGNEYVIVLYFSEYNIGFSNEDPDYKCSVRLVQ